MRSLTFLALVLAVACADQGTTEPVRPTSAVAFGKQKPVFPPIDTIVIPPCNPVYEIDPVTGDTLSIICTNPQ